MEIMPIASGSSGNAYRVTDGETALLLEAGIPIRAIQIAVNFRLRALEGCFITHCHGDHSKAARDLLRLGVDVYTGRGTVEACGLRGHRVHITTPLEQITVGSWDVLPFDVQHDAPDSQGFLFTSRATGEKLLYFTDTYFIKYRFSDEVIEKLNRIQWWNWSDELIAERFDDLLDIDSFVEKYGV